MSVDLKPLGPLELWSRPSAGEVASWVRLVVAMAAMLAIMLVAASAAVLWRMDGSSSGFDRTWFHRAPPVYMAFVLGLVAVYGGTVSRFVRLAVALPIVHAIALVVAMFWVPYLDLPDLLRRTPLYDAVHGGWVFAAMLALTVGIARLVGGRREWVHATVMIALANLLLLGLWLPIAAAVWSQPADDYGTWFSTFEYLKVSSNQTWLVVVMLAPPLLVATIYTTLSLRIPDRLKRCRNVLVAGLIWLLVGAVVARVRGDSGAILIYDNFVHIVLAVLMVAIVATTSLAVATWIAAKSSRRQLAPSQRPRHATISDEDADVVACMQITSWLRGPRVWTRSFRARIGDTELLVPGGAKLATPVPLISSAMRLGEAVVVLKQGDEVKLGGFVERDVGEDPFRSTRLVVPGSSGITVGCAQEAVTPLQSVGMMVWRPSVAYLMITIVVAIPVLAGLLSKAAD